MLSGFACFLLSTPVITFGIVSIHALKGIYYQVIAFGRDENIKYSFRSDLKTS